MPTHIHLILKQNKDSGITKYVSKLFDSFTRYFNIKYHRKGPLWEGHFKNIIIDTDEQLMHLTRYIHLNPDSAGLTNKPQDWQFSSYNEYIGNVSNKICDWQNILQINIEDYKKFVNNRIAYQKELSKIKKLLIENYSG
jgi:putative transposase